MKSCACGGCKKPARGNGPYCRGHADRNRLYGHPNQPLIANARLRPFEIRVREFMIRNSRACAWALTEEQVKRQIKSAAMTLAKYWEGIECFTSKTEAAAIFMEIATNVSFEEILAASVAVWLLEHEDKNAFLTKEAFKLHLARRFLALRPSARDQGVIVRGGTPAETTRKITPRVLLHLAEILDRVFMPVGHHLAFLQWMDQNEKVAAERRWHESIDELR